MSALDKVLAFVKVLTSQLSGPSFETTFNVTGIGGFGLDASGSISGGADDSDEGGEQATEQVGYGPLGLIGRPLPPDRDLFAEAIALRVDGGLAPMGWRDMRLHQAVNPGGSGGTPAVGQLLFAGYGGAFLSHALTPDAVGSKRANVSTWYVPYDFDSDGVPAKAHVISIDPTPGNSSISIVHADGARIALTDGPGISWAVDDVTFGAVRPGEFTVNAARIMLKGNVYLGRAPEAVILPLQAGTLSQPCPSLYLSPT